MNITLCQIVFPWNSQNIFHLSPFLLLLAARPFSPSAGAEIVEEREREREGESEDTERWVEGWLVVLAPVHISR